MILESIKNIEVDKIVKEITTIGSAPLLILSKDRDLYYSKTTVPHPCVELINEVICSYVAQYWNLKTPSCALAKFDQAIIDNYKAEEGLLSNRYPDSAFGNNVFYASKALDYSIEIDSYIESFNRRDYKLFEHPIDIIKIGVMDLWIGNKDRKPENPNILINTSNNQLHFCPIDHTAAFGYCSNHKTVRDVLLTVEPRHCILGTRLVKFVAQYSQPSSLKHLKTEIIENMQTAVDNLDFIFEQIPVSWGLSKGAKQHLKNFLADTDRNERVASSYLSYLK